MHVSGLGGDTITHVSSSSTGHTAAGGSVPAGGGHLAPPIHTLRDTDRGSQRVGQLSIGDRAR